MNVNLCTSGCIKYCATCISLLLRMTPTRKRKIIKLSLLVTLLAMANCIVLLCFTLDKPKTEKRTTYRMAIITPTVPYIYKGSDSRLVHILSYLSNRADLSVTLIYYLRLKDETSDAVENDIDVFKFFRSHLKLEQILGPLGDEGLVGVKAKYDIVMYWTWLHLPYLNMIRRSVRQLLRNQGQTKVIAGVDDDTVALRYAAPFLNGMKRHEIEDIVLSLRPKQMVSKEIKAKLSKDRVKTLIKGPYDLSELVAAELECYQLADRVITISPNSPFIKRYVDGHKFGVLRYSATEYTSTKCSAPEMAPWLRSKSQKFLIFVGFHNFANLQGLKFFASEVLPRIRTPNVVLNVVGFVQCKNITAPNGARIVCRGKISDISGLYKETTVAINPSLECTGVATKTCSAMLCGVPVVTFDCDGTIAHLNPKDSLQRHGVSICPTKNATCMASKIDDLFTDSSIWLTASKAAIKFIPTFYDKLKTLNDIDQIINVVKHLKLRLLFIVDVNISLTRLNFISGMISAFDNDRRFDIFIVGDELKNFGDLNNSTTFSKVEYIPTGLQFHFVIHLTWPINLYKVPVRICGIQCRLILLMSWQLIHLPQSWIAQLNRRYDMIWTTSASSAERLFHSGIEFNRVSVMPEAVHLDQKSTSMYISKRISKLFGSNGFTFLYYSEDISMMDLLTVIKAFQTTFKLSKTKVSLVICTPRTSAPGDVIKRIEELIQHDNRIIWHSNDGNIERSRNLLMKADALILPSCVISPTIGLLEAISYKIPVLHSTSDQYDSAAYKSWKLISYPIDSQIKECIDYPCRKSGISIPCEAPQHYCSLETRKQPLCTVMNELHLSKSMEQILLNQNEVSNKQAEAIKYINNSPSWSEAIPIYVSSIMTLMDSPYHSVGVRETWMSRYTNYFKLIGPNTWTFKRKGDPILRSRSGRWQLDISHTAQLMILDSHNLQIRWMSNSTDNIMTKRGILEITNDCKLVVKDENFFNVWTSTIKSFGNFPKDRHQCILRLQDDGVLSMSYGRYGVVWSSTVLL